MPDIKKLGAVGDGRTNDSEAFRQAVEQCQSADGGTITVPPGTYLIDPLQLCSHLRLHLDSGAILRFTDDFSRFPIVHTRWAGFMCHCLQPCLFGDRLEDIAITGQGILDGQGQRWWDEYKAMRGNPASECHQYSFESELAKLNAEVNVGGAVWDEWERMFLRPPLLQLKDCRKVLIDGITVRNSPFWNTHLLFCEDVTVHAARFENPPQAPNGDGLDIDSSRRVRISDCSFNVGDDCLCLKSGIDACGRAVARPTEDVVVANCTMYRGHGGVVMGSDTAGSIRSVAISNCIFHGTDRGVRIKSRRGRGGIVEDVQVQNIVMTDVDCPLVMNLYYTCGATGDWAEVVADPEARPADETTPRIRRISLSGITVSRARLAAGSLIGLPEAPVEDVSLRDVRIAMVEADKPAKAAMSFQCAPSSGAGFMARHVDGLTLNDVSVDARCGDAFDIQQCRGVRNLTKEEDSSH